MNSQMLSYEDRFRDAACTAVSAVQDLNVLFDLNRKCNEALTEAKALLVAFLGNDVEAEVFDRARDWLAKVG